MADLEITLTSTDREILESHKTLSEGLSNYLGDGYEIALHSLEDLDHSVIKIINGFHTGRKEGAPITDLALNMLANIAENGEKSYISYNTQNRRGEPMRSCTIGVMGENSRIIGLLCMNFYLNTPFSAVLSNMGIAPDNNIGLLNESFADSVSDMLTQTVNSVYISVTNNTSIPASQKTREIVHELYKKGVFNIKDSVQKTSDIIGISRNTIYIYLRELEGH